DDRATLFEKLEEVRAARGLTFVHPFDDPVVLAGAGTAGLEILEDVPEADVVVVPVGGGGLLAGVASAAKQIRPAVRIVAVAHAAREARRRRIGRGRDRRARGGKSARARLRPCRLARLRRQPGSRQAAAGLARDQGQPPSI